MNADFTGVLRIVDVDLVEHGRRRITLSIYWWVEAADHVVNLAVEYHERLASANWKLTSLGRTRRQRKCRVVDHDFLFEVRNVLGFKSAVGVERTCADQLLQKVRRLADVRQLDFALLAATLKDWFFRVSFFAVELAFEVIGLASAALDVERTAVVRFDLVVADVAVDGCTVVAT